MVVIIVGFIIFAVQNRNNVQPTISQNDVEINGDFKELENNKIALEITVTNKSGKKLSKQNHYFHEIVSYVEDNQNAVFNDKLNEFDFQSGLHSRTERVVKEELKRLGVNLAGQDNYKHMDFGVVNPSFSYIGDKQKIKMTYFYDLGEGIDISSLKNCYIFYVHHEVITEDILGEKDVSWVKVIPADNKYINKIS